MLAAAASRCKGKPITLPQVLFLPSDPSAPGTDGHSPRPLPWSAPPLSLLCFLVYYPPRSPHFPLHILTPHTPYSPLGSALGIPFQPPSLSTLPADAGNSCFLGSAALLSPHPTPASPPTTSCKTLTFFV